jgi:hypothetical protein
MRIISHHPAGKPFKVMRELLPDDNDLLLRYYTNDGSVEGSMGLREQAGKLISSIHQLHGWLACDCRSDSLDRPPILFPRVKSGTYSLVRNADRTEHDENCPFKWDPGELSGREGAEAGGKPNDIQPDFILYREVDQIASAVGSAGQRGKPHGGVRQDSLQRRLFWLLSVSGVNQLSSDPISEKTACDAIRRVSEGIHLTSRITLDHLLWTSSKWLTEGWAERRLKGLAELGWPERHPPQGFFLLGVDEIEGKSFVVGNTQFEVEGGINVFSSDSGRDETDSTGKPSSRAPYLILVSARLNDKTGKLRLVRAYAHPRMNGSFFPVDSNFEREAARSLLYVVKKAKETNGCEVTVEKPLQDMFPLDPLKGCRPDFIVRAGADALVIETMGFADQAYRDRKVHTHQTMKAIGTLMEDERVGVNAEEANKRLIGRVLGWLRTIGKLPPR